MSDLWFRVALAMLAVGVASAAIVDQTLWRLHPTAASLQIMTASYKPKDHRVEAARPTPPTRLRTKRSLFTAVDQAETDESPTFASVENVTPILRGVLILGPNRQALVATDADSEGEWVTEGERVVGGLVEIIQRRRAFLRRGDDGFWIELAPPGG